MRKDVAYLAAILALGSIVAANGCNRVDQIKKTTTEKLTNSDIRSEIESMYQRVKETGEKVPDDAIQWAMADVKKIGDWDYKIVRVSGDDPDEIEKTLNDLGGNRWDCFWVDEEGNVKTLYMKRTARSYLKHIPLRDVLKAIPTDQGE